MKKIENCVISAPKLSKTGSIKYCLWVDEKGNLYVQMIENEESGTFSNHLFPVSKYQSERRSTKALGSLEAFNIGNNTFEKVDDNNNGAFLKAVLIHLLPSGDQ
ncbi:hypothetical protein [Stutzerimonas stutzeri]|uniref:hypothetical protein n=1 Tax=Stutzerimonas stutzeri TaxID=316 RepID=UPI000F836011|nr:hypothetical protein [Stutzerimonas stutzeri]